MSGIRRDEWNWKKWGAGGGSESLAPINNYSSIDTAEYSSTAVQQYNSTAPAGEQDCRFHTAHAERWSADFAPRETAAFCTKTAPVRGAAAKTGVHPEVNIILLEVSR